MSSFFWGSYTLLWLLVGALTLLNLVLFRQLGIFIMGTARGIHRSGIPVGHRLPIAESSTTTGAPWSTAQVVGRPHLLFF